MRGGLPFVFAWVAAWCIVAAGAAWGGTIKGTARLTGAPVDRKSTRLNSSHIQKSRMPSSA